MTLPTVLRTRAAQATVDRFRGKPFAFGSTDCVRMVAFHLRQLGYRPQLSKGGAYRTALSAAHALKKAGYDSIGSALDDIGLPRIAYAQAMVGDIVQLPSSDALPALVIVLGNGRVFGHHPNSHGAAPLSVKQDADLLAGSLSWQVLV